MDATIIELEGAFNARSFGARPWLVRSSALDALTPAGVERLRELGVTTIVDLRSAGEGSPLELDAVRRVAVPVLGGQALSGAELAALRLGNVYDEMVELRGGALATAVAAIADAEGAALVHCAVGKDRTGLVVALLLLAVGVERDLVVADYARSGAAVTAAMGPSLRATLAAEGLDDAAIDAVLLDHLDSPAHLLERALDAIDARHGGAIGFLHAHGVDDATLDRLRAKAAAGDVVVVLPADLGGAAPRD